MEFKDKIKSLRTDLNMTMEELAKQVGVSTPTIQRYESGEIRNVKRDKIKLLANALQTSPAYLMGWEDMKYRLRDARASRGLTKQMLAQKIGMTTEEVSDLDIGNLSVIKSREQLDLLSQALNVHIVYILGIDSPGDFDNDDYINMLIDSNLCLSNSDGVSTIAAHKANNENWTPDELKKIEEYKQLLLAARNNKK